MLEERLTVASSGFVPTNRKVEGIVCNQRRVSILALLVLV